MTRTAKATSFPGRLREARERAGFSQNDLAGAVGLTSGRQAINAYESGRVDPKRGMVERLAEVLKVSACWLAFGDEKRAHQELKTSVPDVSQSIQGAGTRLVSRRRTSQ